MPVYEVTDPQSGTTLELTGDSPPTEDELNQIFSQYTPKSQEPQTQEPSMYQQAGQAVAEHAPALPEFGAAVTRGATKLADVFSPIVRAPGNRLLQMAGSDYRIPSVTDAAAPVTKGEFMQPGLTRDVVRAAGETASMGGAAGAGLRTAGKALPAMMPGEGTAVGVGRSLTKTTPQLEAGLGALAGAGAETGEYLGDETGELVGAIAAPTIPGIAKSASAGIANAFRSMSGKGESAAAKLLAEAMAREGIGPQEAARIYKDMGPEAVPADIGQSFSRLLRLAVNKLPRIEGQQRQILNQRHEQQMQRIDTALDQAGRLKGQDLENQLDIIDKEMTPEISRLYGEARSQPLQLSDEIRTILETKGRVNDAFKQAQKNVGDMRLAGEEITHVSVIDETKKVLDDKIGKAIRNNRKNEARTLTVLKNKLVSEADKSIPKYKDARNLYAGKAALINASESGKNYLKLKPREVRDLTKTYSNSEKQMFKLGMREALLDRADSLQVGADAMRRTFGKKGDLNKLRFLFDEAKDFNQFRDALKLESEFALTRRTAQSNSTTFEQASDADSFYSSIADTVGMLSMPDGAIGFLTRMASKLKGNKKGSKAAMDALEEVGDFLLIKGLPPEKVRSMLSEGNADRILDVANRLKSKPSKFPPVWAAGAISAARGDQDNNTLGNE